MQGLAARAVSALSRPLSSSLLAASASGTSSQCFAASAYDVGSSTNIRWHEGAVSTQAKEAMLGQRGAVLWFTGLSGSGKSTVACTLEHALAGQGRLTTLLDGDNVRCV
jgi:adenylylsulfate kinase